MSRYHQAVVVCVRCVKSKTYIFFIYFSHNEKYLFLSSLKMDTFAKVVVGVNIFKCCQCKELISPFTLGYYCDECRTKVFENTSTSDICIDYIDKARANARAQLIPVTSCFEEIIMIMNNKLENILHGINQDKICWDKKNILEFPIGPFTREVHDLTCKIASIFHRRGFHVEIEDLPRSNGFLIILS